MFRFSLRQTGAKLVLAGVLLGTHAGFAQIAPGPATASQNAQPVSADSSASADQAPLTPRERQMLKRIQELENRLKAVEAKVGSSSAAVPESPAPRESSSNESSAVLVTSTPSPQTYGKQQPQPQPTPPTAAPGSNSPPTASQAGSPQSPTAKNPYSEQEAGTEAGEAANEPEMWGEWNPGPGFKVARTDVGELNLSGYMVGRYLNQLPGEQTAFDHNGNALPVQARQDFQLHRIMLYTSGWLFSPSFKYYTFVWSVLDTAMVAVGGSLVYDFNDHIYLGIGINPLPVTWTVQGNHPYWPSYDRMMADEFMRPFFTQGVFGGGVVVRRLTYKWMVGNNLSTLNVRATQLTRELNFGGELTWMPTTGEFGPRGALGDFEDHQKLATRFGIGYGVSRENRQSNENDPANNTTIRLADSLNIFDTGALAPGVTVNKVTWNLVAANVGLKKHGFWIGGEGYYRVLDDITANGPIPVTTIRDTGFWVQGTAMVVPKLIELYAGTSYIFSNFGKPHEFLYGGNWYPGRTRNWRLNAHIINVDHSPVNSTFGFYTGGLKGPILAFGVTAFY